MSVPNLNWTCDENGTANRSAAFLRACQRIIPALTEPLTAFLVAIDIDPVKASDAAQRMAAVMAPNAVALLAHGEHLAPVALERAETLMLWQVLWQAGALAIPESIPGDIDSVDPMSYAADAAFAVWRFIKAPDEQIAFAANVHRQLETQFLVDPNPDAPVRIGIDALNARRAANEEPPFTTVTNAEVTTYLAGKLAKSLP